MKTSMPWQRCVNKVVNRFWFLFRFFFLQPRILRTKVVLTALKKGFVAFSQSLKLCLIYFFTSRLFSRWYYTSKLLVLMFADGAVEQRLWKHRRHSERNKSTVNGQSCEVKLNKRIQRQLPVRAVETKTTWGQIRPPKIQVLCGKIT